MWSTVLTHRKMVSSSDEWLMWRSPWSSMYFRHLGSLSLERFSSAEAASEFQLCHWNSFSLRLAHLLPQAFACYWRSLNSFTSMIYICLFSLHWSREHAHRPRAEKEANHRAAVGQEDTQEKLHVLHGLLPEGTKLQFRSTGHRAQQAVPRQGSPQQQDPVNLLKFITSESHFWLWKP